MNKNPIRIPTVAELIAAGFYVDILHRRMYRVAWISPTTGKLVVKEMLAGSCPADPEGAPPEPDEALYEILPTGGLTEVWVTDPESSAEFYGYGRCRDDENYSHKEGVRTALERIVYLMTVVDGKDGFKMTLSV